MILSNFPENPCAERDKLILSEILNNNCDIEFIEITTSIASNSIKLYVFKDALKVGGVRINVSAKLEQTIADYMFCSLLTTKIADLIWEQSELKLLPCPMPISSTTSAMIQHSKNIDKQILKNTDRPISTVGKHWIIDNSLKYLPEQTAANYGWHFAGDSFENIKGEASNIPGTRLIQGKGTRHDLNHVDYSQTCVLVARECSVNGKLMDLLDVFKDTTLSLLVNYTGPLYYTRQAGVYNSNSNVQFII